jgi:hypothetical protein
MIPYYFSNWKKINFQVYLENCVSTYLSPSFYKKIIVRMKTVNN